MKKEKEEYLDDSMVGSAYEDVPVGILKYHLGKVYKLVFKKRSDYWDTCPYCDSEDSFHRACMDKKIFDNVYRVRRMTHGDKVRSLSKINLCFVCGREWVIEIFVWRIINEGINDPRRKVKK